MEKIKGADRVGSFDLFHIPEIRRIWKRSKEPTLSAPLIFSIFTSIRHTAVRRRAGGGRVLNLLLQLYMYVHNHPPPTTTRRLVCAKTVY
jgi:hypothetical protein